MLTEKEDIGVLMQAAAFAKIPPEKLKPEQPWKYTGKTAELLQIAVESIAPEKAAEWRSDAGGCISLATQAAELGLTPHTKETREDLLKHDPVAVIQQRAAQEQWEKTQLAAMDKAASEMRLRRTGSAEIDETPNFGTGWQAQSLKRQYELERAMGGNWN